MRNETITAAQAHVLIAIHQPHHSWQGTGRPRRRTVRYCYRRKSKQRYMVKLLLELAGYRLSLQKTLVHQSTMLSVRICWRLMLKEAVGAMWNQLRNGRSAG